MNVLFAAAFATLLFVPSALAADRVLADFEGADYAGWTTTGSAFGTGPARGTFSGQQNVGGFRGNGLVNSFLGGDGPTGTLTSPAFPVSQRYLNFLVGGGAHEGRTCINILIDDKAVRTTTGRDDEFLNMATFDLGEFAGRQARIQIVDAASGGWGHINSDHFVLSDAAATPPVEPLVIDTSRLYDETYRPQFHFTAREGWHNDPNGLVFFGGEYHLFFQHNPKGREWGNMTWGHAVSRDLVHWKQLEHALYPDRTGTMFSGSAVVDWKNTGGFQSGKDPALVAFYTAAGGTSDESKGQPFTQALAYSNDRGRSWTKFPGNPVVPNVGEGDRDPKVFWHAPTKRWIMPLYVGEKDASQKDDKGKPVVRHICHFYTSPDLKTWSFASKFAEELYECPGLVELPVDGRQGRMRWVLWGGSGDYWVGQFDGREFKAETPKLKGDYGANYYAAQAYDELPDHRVVLITWMNGGKYPGMPFNQQMGFPVTLELRTTPEGPRLRKWPVKEIERLYPEEPAIVRVKTVPLNHEAFAKLEFEVADVTVEIPDNDFTINVRGFPIRWEARARKLVVRGREATLSRTKDHAVRLRLLVDRTSIETFADDGLVTFSDCFVPRPGDRRLRIEASPGNTVSMEIRSLRSAWQE